MKDIVTAPSSRFVQVSCKKCKNEMVIFNKPATQVKCKCGEDIAKPTGGEALLNAKLLQKLQ